MTTVAVFNDEFDNDTVACRAQKQTAVLSFLSFRTMCMCVCVCLCAVVLEEVKDTYHDVRRLEASIIELHKMFMDLALLVDRQGEMLDQIEFQVKIKTSFFRLETFLSFRSSTIGDPSGRRFVQWVGRRRRRVHHHDRH